MECLSDVQRFYFDKVVLITGGTGFVGKLLIEKLLRSCPGIKRLYLLVRKKKGKDIYTRFNEIISEPVFDRLKQEFPKFREKIFLIPGDCFEDGLGISDADKELLTVEVNIIFHLAATVRFNEHLKTAINVNVRACSDMLVLAKNMKKLETFMNVSTAFSNAPLQFIEETNYDIETDWRQLLKDTQSLTDKQMSQLLPKILGSWPNTYTFTKALAEKEILLNAGTMPVGIFRPAIVISTADEPIRSWIDNFYGATGVVVATGKGILHSLHCDRNTIAELVPADYSVNCLVIAAYDMYISCEQKKFEPHLPLIYNYVSSVENRINWKQFKDRCGEQFDVYPFNDSFWYTSLTFNKHKIVHFLYTVFFHWIPALIVDLLTMLTLNKPRMLKLYKKIHAVSSALEYFTVNEIKFCNKRTRMLWERCSTQDKKLFPFSMAELDWDRFFKEYALGIRRYALHEIDEQLQQAKARFKMLRFCHRGLKCCSLAVLIIVSLTLINNLV